MKINKSTVHKKRFKQSTYQSYNRMDSAENLSLDINLHNVSTNWLEVRTLHSKDDDSDEEIVYVSPDPKPIVPKVNSFEKKPMDSKYMNPECPRNLCNNCQKFLNDIIQKLHYEQILNNFFAKQKEEALSPIEERIKKYKVITETITLDDEEEPKLPELTPSMLEQIQAAVLVPHPPSAVIAQGFGLTITRNDMHTLANVNWLNDDVINFYINLIIERGEKEVGLPKVYAFNTFFYPKLMQSGHASLKTWTRRIDIFTHDLIIVPVHLRVHWCMAVIDLKNKVVEYYDSRGRANNKCLKALLKYLEDESIDKKNTPYDMTDWKAVNMKDIPRQMNDSDCGVFACTFAEYKCRNATFTFSHKQMPYFRKKMAYEILTGRLMM